MSVAVVWMRQINMSWLNIMLWKYEAQNEKTQKKTTHVTAVDRNSKNMMSESDKTSEEYEEWCMSP